MVEEQRLSFGCGPAIFRPFLAEIRNFPWIEIHLQVLYIGITNFEHPHIWSHHQLHFHPPLQYWNTKTTALLKELLQSKSISSSNTRIEALILGRGPKYILKKGFAEFGINPSTTREV